MGVWRNIKKMFTGFNVVSVTQTSKTTFGGKTVHQSNNVFSGNVVSGNIVGGDMVINGNSKGLNITMINGKMYINGVLQQVAEGVHTVNITVNGNVEGDVSNTSGTVIVSNDVQGSVSSTSGDVQVKGSVGLDAKTVSGDIFVTGQVHGHVATVSGDISMR